MDEFTNQQPQPPSFTAAEIESLATFFGQRSSMLQFAGTMCSPKDLGLISDAWKANHAMWKKFSAVAGFEALAVPSRAVQCLTAGDEVIGALRVAARRGSEAESN